MVVESVSKMTRKPRNLTVLTIGLISCVLAGVGMIATGIEAAGLVSATSLVVVFGGKGLARSIRQLWGNWKWKMEGLVFPGDRQSFLISMGRRLQRMSTA